MHKLAVGVACSSLKRSRFWGRVFTNTVRLVSSDHHNAFFERVQSLADKMSLYASAKLPGDDNKATLFDYLAPTGFTNLKMGAPGVSQLKRCAEILSAATVHRMQEPDAHWLFQYGPEVGDRRFIETLAAFLTTEYQDSVDPETIVVSAGATQALSLLANQLFSADDLVFIENPTYFIAIRMLEHDVGLKTIAVPMDEYGIIPEKLEEALEAHKSHRPREITSRKPFWSMLYIMPTLHNPTGICLPPDRCMKILDLARKYNLLVVCDDVYNLLYFPREDGSVPNLKRLFAYDNRSDPTYQGNVVSNGSFSKIFGPGIRLGWMEMPMRVKSLIMTSGVAMSGGGFNHTASGIMTSVISMGMLTEVLKEARRVNQARCEAACRVLKSKVPGLELAVPQGGYFIWMKLPNGVQSADLVKRCEKDAEITFFTGDLASPTGAFGDHIRISFSYYEKDELVDAVDKVADAINMAAK